MPSTSLTWAYEGFPVSVLSHPARFSPIVRLTRITLASVCRPGTVSAPASSTSASAKKVSESLMLFVTADIGTSRSRVCLLSGAPIIMSSPHFYQADDRYVQDVFGMNPNKDEHETLIDVNPVSPYKPDELIRNGLFSPHWKQNAACSCAASARMCLMFMLYSCICMFPSRTFLTYYSEKCNIITVMLYCAEIRSAWHRMSMSAPRITFAVIKQYMILSVDKRTPAGHAFVSLCFIIKHQTTVRDTRTSHNCF